VVAPRDLVDYCGEVGRVLSIECVTKHLVGCVLLEIWVKEEVDLDLVWTQP
jgi:hypothetical protein